MKKIFIKIICLLLFYNNLSSQILYESFEGEWSPSPVGWYQEFVQSGSGSGSDKYFIKATKSGSTWSPVGYGNPTSPQDGSSVAYYNDYNAQAGQIDRLATENIDLSAATNVKVTFYYYYQAGAARIKLIASKDGGLSWSDISESITSTGSQWKQFSFFLPNEFNVSNARIAFEVTSSWGAYDIFLDNIVIEDVPPALTGIKTINNTTAPSYPNFYFIANIFYDFEAETDEGFWHEANYHSAFDEWERGTPTAGTGYPEILPSGEKCWGTKLDGNYSDNASYILYSPRFEATNDIFIVDFSEFLNIEPYPFDSVWVEYQVNNFLWYQYGNIYSRQDTTWQHKIMILYPEAGDDIIIRLVFQSDHLNNFAGWYIDDFIARGAAVMHYANLTVVDEQFNPVSYPHIWLDNDPEYWLGNENGTKTIPLVDGEYFIEVNGPQEDYLSTFDTININGNDTNMTIILYPISYDLTFNVTDNFQMPLENANVLLNSTNYFTDENGTLHIENLEPGIYDYSVSAGRYYTMETGTADLTNSSQIIDIMLITISINELTNLVNIFPNPVKDFVYINNISNEVINQIMITDITGKILLTQNVVNQDDISLDLQLLASGIYFTKIRFESKEIVRKIVVD